MAKDEALTRDWKDTIDERIARDNEFKESLLQEPYAYAYVREDGVGQLCWTKRDTSLFKDVLEGCKEIPLYTHPAPSWQGLSNDEIDNAIYHWERHNDYKHNREIILLLIDFARAIVQALRNKNENNHSR